jgi:methylsterol monooxygenase
VFYNQIVVGNLFAIAILPLQWMRGVRFDRASAPSAARVGVDIVLCAFVEEVVFYSMHRIMHTRYLYERIHKIHHEWVAPIGMVALYAHPVEHVLCNLLPVALGPLLLGSHLYVWWLWLTLATFAAVLSHSGLDIPVLSPEFHDLHHRFSKNNYGVLGILDGLFGTDRELDKCYDELVI